MPWRFLDAGQLSVRSQGRRPTKRESQEGARRLGGNTVCVDADNRFRTWRMARIDDVVLINQAADETAPRSINCYLVEVEDIDAASRLLYALRWLDRGEPPDLDLTLVRDPATWFDYVSMLLFGALNRDDPHLFDRLRTSLN